MKKALIAAVLAFSSLTGTAFAEQPKAAEYRAMLASGKYYLEYSRVAEYADAKLQKRSDKYSKSTREIFVADGGQRAILSMGGRYGNGMAMRMENSRAVGKLFRNASSNAASLRDELKLDLLYQEGNYYQFFGKNKALRLSEAEAASGYADPRAEWGRVRQTLAAPAFLPAFALPESEDMRFVGSGTETIFAQPMTVDTYILRVHAKDGDKDVGVPYAYKYYYDETGELRYIGVTLAEEGSAQGTQKPLRGKGGSLGTYIRIDSFSGEIPADVFAYPKDAKIYCILPGSLDDLFGYGELVETQEQQRKDEGVAD